jgi:HEAT repeat protein
LRYAKAGGALMKAAKIEGEIEVRAEMLIAVGAVGDKKQAAGLEAFLDDSSESARFAAAQGLCLLGNKKGFEFAKKKLQSADRYERIEGLKLFEGSRARDVAAVLTPMLEDSDRAVAAMTARLLDQGGDPKMLDWLVLKSFQTMGDDKLAYEKELEALRLPDDQRKSILAKAGIK